ncbi:hypothetical protein H7849_14965 [Alloacidobacterium dinghuense]|uniref:Uncharacterized protein n=1 Tax=Alloacidobacterium dinghuense TaxID=2763107 RepID=A0A7G8BD31_9BACT|nr:hypothetical protein [Alloacidobacterium dinghuense]QNI30451.1 hypothetical protein H7849_14965 [Alloacidobacterium dinghuense]
MSDIAAQVGTLPSGMNYLVLSVANEATPTEMPGQAHYSQLLELNNDLAVAYGIHYLDVRSILVNSYDPSSPIDVSDFRYDIIPSSLRSIEGIGTLSGDIGPADQLFTVNMAAGTLQKGFVLTVENESIYVSRVSGSTVTECIRGFGGIVSGHSAGSSVTELSPTHLNKHGDAVVANAVSIKLHNISGIP